MHSSESVVRLFAEVTLGTHWVALSRVTTENIGRDIKRHFALIGSNLISSMWLDVRFHGVVKNCFVLTKKRRAKLEGLNHCNGVTMQKTSISCRNEHQNTFVKRLVVKNYIYLFCFSVLADIVFMIDLSFRW